MNTPRANAPRSQWTRFWQKLALLEEEMSLGYDGLQDRRLDNLEAEVRILKTELAALRQESVE